MKNNYPCLNVPFAIVSRKNRAAGFSMVEMLFAVGLFLIIGGATMGLFAKHAPFFSKQQNMAGLNAVLRNAVAQMQIDVVNAGTGYYAGANIPDWPVGVTITNSNGVGCFNAANNTYGPSCFDSLNVITTDLNTPPAHPDLANGVGGCFNTANTTLLLTPPTPSGAGAPLTAAAFAGSFKTGDQVLLVKSDGSQMTTTVLTANGGAAGGAVQLTHKATNADGTNTAANDPLGITAIPGAKLGITFCNNDWLLKLTATTYFVDAVNPANPKLSRTEAGVTSVIAEQIIGFKIGAATYNNLVGSDFYSYDAAAAPPAGYANNFQLIRSVRVSLIGRTDPNTHGSDVFQNTFDGGRYHIKAMSVVINPRNMSMNDK